jgi:hypothetical protein
MKRWGEKKWVEGESNKGMVGEEERERGKEKKL